MILPSPERAISCPDTNQSLKGRVRSWRSGIGLISFPI